MRFIHLLPCLLLVAACGDNGNGATNPHKDGGHDIDGPDIDAAIDAPAGPQDHSRVWAIGDFVTDQTINAAKFNNGDTLPLVAADVAFPTAPAVLSAAGNRALVFDATKTKTAFIADLTTAGTFDIYIGDKDGANATVLVPANGTVLYQGVTLSPDGTKLAFLADSVLAGMIDLFVVPTDGSTAPVKVSPDRAVNATNLDVFSIVTWSLDSKFLAFSGGLTVNTISQAFVVDTSVATPAAVTLLDSADVTPPGVGVRGALVFDDQNNVYFRATLTLAAGPFTFFKVGPDGSGKVTNPSFIPARGDTTAPDVGAFGTSPDGKTLVFSADSPALGAYNLYSVTLGGADPAVNMTGINASPAAGTVHADFSAPLWFAPDGKSVAVVANFLGVRNEPYIVKLDGSNMKRLAAIDVGCGTCDASILQWTEDGKTLYLEGDITVNNDGKIYKLDAATTDQTPTLAIDVPTGGDFASLIIR